MSLPEKTVKYKLYNPREKLERRIRSVNMNKIRTRLLVGLDLTPEQKRELVKILES